MAQNLVNGKRYVGKTTAGTFNRWGEHVRNSRKSDRSHSHLENAIRKYGSDAFHVRVIATGIPCSELGTHERFWIRYYGTFDNGVMGYNHTTGGDSEMHSDVTKTKISTTQRAKVERGEHHLQNPVVRAKIVATQKAQGARGKHASQRDEVRAKNSATQKAKVERGEHPMQDPENPKKGWATRRRQNREAASAAGQQFFC